MAQSARFDVDVDHMIKAGKTVRQVGVSYYVSDPQEELLHHPEGQKGIKEIFGPLVR